ncbi:MvdC/MvdD family ATP grasp protein [Pseudonocardia acaciae]|uniref:MvdC/MvdD family ATP grasp protein n=1 Tax=Pseudonocardia acaciae TaxID=551276 RepID=UPI0006881668|nr:hypothetical protein [Pseudonocardia acaciae]
MLVVTAPVDPTADMVLTHLEADGVPFLRLDAAQFPTVVRLTGEIGAGGPWSARLDGVQLDTVEAVYYRRPGRFEFDTAIPLDMIEWCEGQARFGFWGVLESLPARWINAPTAVHRAEYKPRQLAHAVNAGLSIPDTLVTNDPDAVAEFAVRHPDGIITKTLYARMPRTEAGHLSGVVYTNTVPPQRYRDPTIAATAHLFQAQLKKRFDVRATVVDGQVYAARIDNLGELDWRRSHRKITYQPYELPDSVAAGIHRLMASLGLVFGALDFVVTDQADETHQFIEINPNGQWGWIENHTGQPISRALADALKGDLS